MRNNSCACREEQQAKLRELADGGSALAAEQAELAEALAALAADRAALDDDARKLRVRRKFTALCRRVSTRSPETARSSCTCAESNRHCIGGH